MRLLNATQTSLEAAAAERERQDSRWEPWPAAPARERTGVRNEPAAEPEDVPDDDVAFEDTILGAMTDGGGTAQVNGYLPADEDEVALDAEEAGEDAILGDELDRGESKRPISAAGRAVPSPHPASVDSHMEIQFQRLSEKATLPARAHEGDAGMDLCAAEAASIGPGQRVQVGTGLAVEIPEGWAGMVLPRSGLALKNGISLVNAPGLIDPGYRGEIRVLLLNTDASSEFKVAVGDRVAQLVLTPFSTARPVEAGGLSGSERGSAGFGSSGA